MTEALPGPMVPPEVDLRGLKYMPLLGGRLFGSNFDLDANDAEFRVGLRLWWAAWNQVPAGSLPAEDHRIRGLAGLMENPAKWKKVRERALDGFTLCSDGRLYHPIVAEQALIAWEKRAEDLEERENEADRQRRLRQDRKRMFADLRKAGVTPKWDIGTTELRALHKEHVTDPVTTPVTGTETVTDTPTVTVTSTAKTGRDGTGRIEEEVALADIPPQQRAPTDDSPPEANGHPPTMAGKVCKAMRKAGLQQTNPGDPRFLALIEQGASEEEFVGIAQEAIAKRISAPWAWVLKVLQERRAEAAAITLARPVSKPNEPSGRLPEYVAPKQFTPEEQAASDAARIAAMKRLGRVAT